MRELIAYAAALLIWRIDPYNVETQASKIPHLHYSVKQSRILQEPL